jgi:4-amino-4-deoxychorismate lyase
MPIILVNGVLANTLEIADRGLQYGDGLFETLAVIKGHPVFLTQHLRRLQKGCQALAIALPNHSLLSLEIAQLSSQAAQHIASDNAVIKVIVTRGVGGRGYRPPDQPKPTRIVSLHPFPSYNTDYNKQGIRTIFCHTRLGINPSLAGIKHLNRLEQVLARAEWHDPTIQEGIMLDINGHVIEGTMSNLFYIQDDIIHTACLKASGIDGIIRQQLISLARQQGFVVLESNITPAALLAADEVFVCNSIIGIWPVHQIDRQLFAIGQITQHLQLCLAQKMHEDTYAH